MNKQPFEDRLRHYLTRTAEAPPAGIEDRVLSAAMSQPAGHSRLVQAFAATAALVVVAGIAFAVHGIRQNAGQPSGPKPTPSAVYPTPAPLTGAVSVSSIHMITSSIGWADGAEAASDGSVASLLVLRTSDGGAHWRNVTPPRPWQPSSTGYFDENSAWAASFYPHKYLSIMRTSDGGNHWHETRIMDANAIGPADFSFVDTNHGWFFVSYGYGASHEAGGLYGTVDGGAHWEMLATTDASDKPGAMPFSGDKTGISFVDARTGWLTATYPGPKPLLYVTHDGGSTWNAVNYPVPSGVDLAGGRAITPPRFFSSTTGEFEVDADQTVIYVTGDGGATWSPRVAPDSGSASFLNARTAWLVSTNGGTIYRSLDGGLHWSATGHAVAFGPLQSVQFVSTVTGFAVTTLEPPGLITTTDGGLTWNQVPITVS